MKQNLHFKLRRPRSSGFTLIEATIVSALMGFLAVLISATWSGMLGPSIDVASRCRVAQEASLAMASLSQDLSGYWSDNRTGSKSRYKFVGRTQIDDEQLKLCFDGDPTNGAADWAVPDVVITYYLDSNALIRWDENSGNQFTVARNMDEFEVIDLGDGQLRIRMTFSYRGTSRTYTLIARDP